MEAVVNTPEVLDLKNGVKLVQAGKNGYYPGYPVVLICYKKDTSDQCAIYTLFTAVYKQQCFAHSGQQTETKGRKGENLDLLHLDCSDICSSKTDEGELMVDVAGYSIKLSTKSIPVHAPSFYSTA